MAVPEREDLRLAREDALLQLRIGRASHIHSVVVSSALLLDAIIALALLYEGFGSTPRSELLLLLLPTAAAVYLGAGGVRAKWNPFQLWPWERHFTLSVIAAGFAGILGAIYVVALAQSFSLLPGGWVLGPTFYLLTLFAITLALVALVLTWRGRSRRQWTGLIASSLPVPLALIVYLPNGSAAPISIPFVISLFLGAALYQMGGSMLHLIASGTDPHERELITSGQSRLFRYANEVRAREERVRQREDVAGRREAIVAYRGLDIGREAQSLAEARSQIDRMEADVRLRSEALSREEAEWVRRAAEVHSKELSIVQREETLREREAALAEALDRLTAREQAAVAKEGELARREVALTQRGLELEARAKSLGSEPAPAPSADATTVAAPGPGSGPGPTADPALSERVAEVARREAAVQLREERLATREAEVERLRTQFERALAERAKADADLERLRAETESARTEAARTLAKAQEERAELQAQLKTLARQNGPDSAESSEANPPSASADGEPDRSSE